MDENVWVGVFGGVGGGHIGASLTFSQLRKKLFTVLSHMLGLEKMNNMFERGTFLVLVSHVCFRDLVRVQILLKPGNPFCLIHNQTEHLGKPYNGPNDLKNL